MVDIIFGALKINFPKSLTCIEERVFWFKSNFTIAKTELKLSDDTLDCLISSTTS